MSITRTLSVSAFSAGLTGAGGCAIAAVMTGPQISAAEMIPSRVIGMVLGGIAEIRPVLSPGGTDLPPVILSRPEGRATDSWHGHPARGLLIHGLEGRATDRGAGIRPVAFLIHGFPGRATGDAGASVAGGGGMTSARGPAGTGRRGCSADGLPGAERSA